MNVSYIKTVNNEQVFHGKKALVSHKAYDINEINFEAGDVLRMVYDMHNGYNYGDHNRTKAQGLYPRFKVEEYVESYPFALFD